MNFKLSFSLIFFISYIALFSQKVDRDVIIEETFLPLISKSDSLNSIKSLESTIEKITSKLNGTNTNYSIAVYSLDQNKYLYKKDILLGLTPASTTKLVTSFLVANLLKDKSLRTEVFYTGKIIDSVLIGDLYIIGGGDPLLNQKDIDTLAQRIRKKGIKQINGNILSDGSIFDNEVSRYKYSRDDDEVQKIPPITGLSIERNTATIKIVAGKKGDYLNVSTIPDSYNLKTIVYGKSVGMNLDLEPQYEFQKYGDQNKDISLNSSMRMGVTSSLSEEGNEIYSISGNLKTGRVRSFRYYLKNPVLVVAGTIRNSLEKIGVNCFGDTEICEIYSIPEMNYLTSFRRDIFEVLEVLNKNSDNYVAENLFKLIGSFSKKYDDNYHGTRDVTLKLFDSLKVSFINCDLNDGSGLSRRNKLTTRTLIEVLKFIYNSNLKEDYIRSLAIAGSDGTLSKRMKNSAAEEILIGKTGTLRNVSSLAGLTTTLDGEMIAYAFIFNGNNVSKYKDIENLLGEELSQFFYFNEER